ncbi:PAS domain S-box protein [Maribacter sp.]|uniref:PAS domain-containing sensor histidine kinase n=1 Tax=Maribacter sp. TaxID=1897614 RepID=UPI0025C0DBE2|nr:PAS domain S-box protein [Maribacter sp.]
MNQLHTDNMLLEKHHQIFIEQTPTAIAMLNKDMVYLAVSKRWLKDFKLEGQDIVGRCHYDVFPEIGDDWKAKNQECLNGAIDVCDEATFHRKDGTIQWIYWDVRPWYNLKGEIGGLLMHTGDITEKKEKELQQKRVDSILKDTSELARIGTWEMNLHTNEITWSKIVYDIYGVSEDYIPNIATNLEFSKNEQTRALVETAVENLLEKGISVDIEYEIINAVGDLKLVKVIGKVEYIEGVASRLFGIIQDVTRIKESETKLKKAHKELETIFNSKSIALITTDKDGIINRFNSGAEELLGYTSEEVIGKHKPELYLLEEEQEQFRNDMIAQFGGDVINSNFNYRNENINDTRQWTFRHKDGSMFSTLTSITAINTYEGVNEGFVAVATDISKIKKVKNELRNKNELLNLAEEISLMGHWQWNPIEDIGFWSNNLFALLDYHGEPFTMTFGIYFEMVHEDDKELVFEHFEKAKKEKIFGKLTHNIITFSGNLKTIQILANVISNEKGEAVKMIGTCQDVTEFKKTEQNLIQAKDNLEIVAQKLASQNKQLADFTHITSHNLRAPVANLNSLMEIYKLSDDEEERLDVFEKFDTVIHRLTLTLNTLIEALKTKTGDSKEELEIVNFEKVLENTTQLLSGVILKSNAVVKSDFSQISEIEYNPIYMDSIFLNLVGNAIKYKAKDRTPEIFIKTEVMNGRNIITFKDNGLGIDLERHGHKLFGLNKVFHRHPDAKGVGLFLTKTQVEAMGGTISATSEVNVGTTFTIIF